MNKELLKEELSVSEIFGGVINMIQKIREIKKLFK